MKSKIVIIIGKIADLITGFLRYNLISKFKVLYPRSVMINLTYKCNSHCVMCNIWKMKPKNELKYEEWEEVVHDPIFRDIKNLTISGGEAFLYKDYVKTIKLFVDSMPRMRRLVLNTNGFETGVIVGNVVEIASYCQKKGIRLMIGVSVDGVGRIHDGIRRTKNGFNNIKKTIVKLKKISKRYDFNLRIASLILRNNINNFEEMEAWCKKQKVDYGFQIVGFLKTFVNNKKEEKYLDFRNDKEKLFRIMEYLRDQGNNLNIMGYYWKDLIRMYKYGKERTTPCSFLKDDFVIDSLGDVYYCLSVRPIGNFLKEKRSVGEIYFDKKNIKFRHNLVKSACKNCNSGCNVANAIAFDAKRFLWYRLSGKLWLGKELDVS
jgi:MoaA/NifB/PqqE/SkfB family radical SAM enzyme